MGASRGLAGRSRAFTGNRRRERADPFPVDDDDDTPITLELPIDPPIELDEDERIEVLLDWAPVVGSA